MNNEFDQGLLVTAEKGLEYVDTIEVCGHTIRVYIDDYGQCYIIMWMEDGQLYEESCGSFNPDYEEYCKMKFDDEYRTNWLRSIGIEPRKQNKIDPQNTKTDLKDWC